jgi:hypothetical protein
MALKLRIQYGLGSLLGLMLAASLLLGAWRVGLMRVAPVVAISTSVLLCAAWVWFKSRELLR